MVSSSIEDGPPAPEVSVVVAVYNGANVIGDCVASLLALEFPRERYEILVVDNGSTDGTAELVRGFGSQVRVSTEVRQGAAAARNRGIREALGRVVAFTDADATVDAGWLGSLVEPLDDRTIGAVGGRILSRRPGNRIERFGEVVHDQRVAIEQFDEPYVCSANWASRRDLLLEIGLFDETLRRGEDVDLAWRMHNAGYNLVYRQDAIVFHRNERTVWRLMCEGFDHGKVGVGLRDKHRTLLPMRTRRRSRVERRVLAHLRQLVVGADRREAALALVFDLGKAAGELVALAE